MCIEATCKGQHEAGHHWEGHRELTGKHTFTAQTFGKTSSEHYTVQGGPQLTEATVVTQCNKISKEHLWL